MKINVLLCLAVLAAVTAGCGKRDVVKLTYSVAFPQDHAQTKLAAAWAEELQRRTGGQVEVTLVPGGAQTSADRCYAGVVEGLSDIGMSGIASSRERFPLLMGLELPVGFPDGASATRIANALAARFAAAEPRDVKLLYVHATGPAVLFARLPVPGADELRGLKVRASGSAAEMAERLGARPVELPLSETGDALRSGAVDAVLCPPEALKRWKLGEANGCMTDCSGVSASSAYFVVMNKKVWDRLPADVRKTIEALDAEWAVKHGEAWSAADAEGLGLLSRLQRDVIPLRPTESARWRERFAPLLSAYTASAAQQKLPGEAFLKELLAAVEEARGARGR